MSTEFACSKTKAVERAKLHPLEFEVERDLKKLSSGQRWNERWLIALSGGQDSIVLLAILSQLKNRLDLELGVAHVHHGPGEPEALVTARDRGAQLSKKAADFYRLPFAALGYSSASPHVVPIGSSEEYLREFRHSLLEAEAKRGGWDRVAFAHHRRDLLETRMIRLIRGTGPAGMMAMRPLSQGRVYPLLALERDRMNAYAIEKRLTWQDDPSNLSHDPLRNWLRLEWLTALEDKRAGAVSSLARSLELVAEILDENQTERDSLLASCVGEAQLDRLIFAQLRPIDQRFVVASYLRTIGARGFGRSHIEEVVKRLDTRQTNLTFDVAKHRWTINAEQIQVAALKPQS